MLPRTNGMWIANLNGMLFFQSTKDVRHQPIQCPIATTNDIACSRRRHGNAFILEKGLSIGTTHQFSTTLAIRIRIITAHRLVFSIAPEPFLVLVAFVSGDIDDCPNTASLTCGL
ncbi:hypothetical protein VI26_09635 [Chromobacterium sp. LK1]|nr:hypothetical protein VI26_09635 [Chromobacterium sp. LK1]